MRISKSIGIGITVFSVTVYSICSFAHRRWLKDSATNNVLYGLSCVDVLSLSIHDAETGKVYKEKAFSQEV